MAGLGLVVMWAGYLLFSKGWWTTKGKAVSYSQLTKPSSREDALKAVKG